MKSPDKPTSLLIECPSADNLLPPDANLLDVLVAHASSVEALEICRARHMGLVDWVNGITKRKSQPQ